MKSSQHRSTTMAPGPPEASRDGGTDAPPSRPHAILLVDDEPDILESLKEILEAQIPGVHVRTAPSGKAGLDILAKEPVDLILTDYRMPGMNGLEFLMKAAEASPGVPRILITAFPDLDIAIKAINEADIEHFFTKPFEPAVVVDSVRALLFERRTKNLFNESFARSLALLRQRAEQED
jgi:response regulator RpfG family c-di-GMP phosphodiesterase